MEKQEKNKKQKNNFLKKSKSNVIKVSLAFSVLITIVIFFLMKIVNALVNNTDILDAFKTIGIIPPTDLSLPNLIDYISNIILLIVLPILVLTWIVLIIKFKNKKAKKAKKDFKASIKNQKVETEIVLEVENPDIDLYPHFEEDKTFFEEINNESDNDLTLLQQRAKTDGSVLIKENLSELVKNAYKIRNYAILNNIEVDDVVLEEMTKKELILFMKKIGNELRKVEYQYLNFKDASTDGEIKITENENINQINEKKQSENIDVVEAGKINQKKPVIRKNKVTKNDLVNSIFSNNENKLTKVKIKKIVDSLFELMENNLVNEGSEIKINNFAKFSTVFVDETTMKDMKTGELKMVPSRKTIKFKSLKGLRESLNNEKV
ncbi:predicted histone-like DNA-binding protein [Mesoplasma florum L1]|uniref:Predicted histone-like DNA-binding protein n=1 Tax=Mesoplasma florum (strain ATCC 33453 / NBRC 100688 / NCTC 11704 / L1) TaxID=265311 RepID=Q6F109_MESFL|nr:HU family DNA-binding protein [Mesoplasma florum]AAT75814.1 predicted histone-like DNA-binding protein [Mesoplasma florum L1]